MDKRTYNVTSCKGSELMHPAFVSDSDKAASVSLELERVLGAITLHVSGRSSVRN